MKMPGNDAPEEEKIAYVTHLKVRMVKILREMGLNDVEGMLIAAALVQSYKDFMAAAPEPNALKEFEESIRSVMVLVGIDDAKKWREAREGKKHPSSDPDKN